MAQQRRGRQPLWGLEPRLLAQHAFTPASGCQRDAFCPSFPAASLEHGGSQVGVISRPRQRILGNEETFLAVIIVWGSGC